MPSDLSIEELEKQIEKQRRACERLLSDLETPHNLDREIEDCETRVRLLPENLHDEGKKLCNGAESLPAQIDKEIGAARVRWQELIDTRDARIKAAEESYFRAVENAPRLVQEAEDKLAALRFRRANTKQMYQVAREGLDALNKRLKTMAHSSKIQKVRTLQQQLAELEAALPASLRGKSMDEIRAALELGQ